MLTLCPSTTAPSAPRIHSPPPKKASISFASGCSSAPAAPLPSSVVTTTLSPRQLSTAPSTPSGASSSRTSPHAFSSTRLAAATALP